MAIQALAGFLLACGDGDHPPAASIAPRPVDAAASRYSIKGYLVKDGERRRVDFSPSNYWKSGVGKKSKELQLETKSLPPPGRSPQAATKCSGSDCTELDDLGVRGEAAGQLFDGETLLLAVTNSCIDDLGFEPLLARWPGFEQNLEDALSNPDDAAALPHVWQDDSWFVFPGQLPAEVGCDEILARQEALLCVADKLVEIADAVVTTKVPFDSDSHWEFPVQDIQDKFLLRDLALRTLGNLGALESYLPLSSVLTDPMMNGVASCSDVYTAVASATTINAQVLEAATFHEDGWLERPTSSEVTRARTILAERANYKVNIFRAAGRMARDLLDKSVQADLAGAEKRKGEAGDPAKGLELLWGADSDDVDSKFNSLRHALATIGGRLDVINPQEDPLWCRNPVTQNEGFEPALLLDALGPGTSARWADRAPQTPGQSLALSLVTQSGVLLPGAASPSDDDVRAVVEEQLVINSARARGVDLTSFQTSAGRDAIVNVLAKVPVSDLRFALARNLDAFRSLTQLSESSVQTLPGWGAAGLMFEDDPGTVSSTVVALGGAAVSGGIPRRDLHVDMMGSYGRAQVVSQCPASRSSVTGAAWWSAYAQLAPLQNVFTFGQGLSHHMTRLAAGFSTVSDVTGKAEVIRNAQSGAAELRSWAGPGTIGATHAGQGVDVILAGLKPEDVGAKDIADMTNHLAFVRLGGPNEQWKADCVAGIRKSCPNNISDSVIPYEPEHISIPAYDSDEPIDLLGATAVGRDLASFTEPLLAGHVHLPGFNASQFAMLALVQLPSGNEPGRVLSTVLAGQGNTPPRYNDLRFEAISNYQRSLLNQTLGTGNPARHGSTCGDVTSTSLPDRYCVAGMDRDMFVPLSNELTSDGGVQEDSWKHYLSLAEAAAAHADDLGVQLIKAGEARELRRESAQESLGDVCGAFVDVDKLSIVNGDVQGDPADSAIAACIDPPTADLVFLTEDKFDSPTKATEKAKVDEAIRDAYCPSTGGAKNPKFCREKDLNSSDRSKRYITHRALGLKTYVAQRSTSNCEQVLELARKVSGSTSVDASVGSALAGIAKEPWVTQAGLFAGFGGIQLKVKSSVDAGGEILWEGRRYNRMVLGPSTLFDSDDPDASEVFPACVELGRTCKGTAELLRKVFNPDDEVLTHTQIRHRVESALFHLGALVGVVPAGTFSVPVPVYNANVDGNPTSEAQGTEAPAVYGNATLNSNLDGEFFTLAIEANNPVRDEAESIALGQALPVSADYWRARKAEDDETGRHAPIWRQNLYRAATAAASTPGTYLTVQGTTPVLMFNDIIQGTEAISRADNVRQWIRELGSDASAGCRAWPNPGALALGLYSYSDKFPVNHWNGGSNADRVAESLQRNICASAIHPVFYEDVQSRQLHLRAFAWHAVGGNNAFKDIIEDLDNPNDAMHKERAVFFEPFSQCFVGQDRAFFPESCFRRHAYTEQEGTLLEKRDPNYVPRDSISGEGNFRRAMENRLQPSVCTPGSRAELFIDRYPDDSCQLTQAVIHGLALACVMGDEPVAFKVGDPPPTIEGVDDLPLYEAWLSMLELQLGSAVNDGFFVDFPEAVLDRASGASGFTSSLGNGAQGTAMLGLANHVEALHSSWTSMAGAIRDLRSAVRSFRLELDALSNEQKQRQLAEHAERLRLTQEIVVNGIKAAGGALKAIGSFVGELDFKGIVEGSTEAGVAATNITYAALQLGNLDDRAELGEEATEIGKDRAALSFTEAALHTFDNLDQSVTGIRTAANQILASLNEISNNRQRAAWELGKVSGADFARIDGQEVAQSVNTVLNRQYNILRIRYEKAVEAAKRAAYLARLSMEQRIGVRLGELRQPIGPLDPPASWVDNLCSVQGIDYEKLRVADPDNPTFDDHTSLEVQGFANQFVGDYVARLKEFIEFYNIEFPFRQADDKAVLSLREDLLVPDAQCRSQSPNELYHSDALYRSGEVTETYSSLRGWQGTGCVEDGCLYVKDGSLLKDATDAALVPPGGIGAVSWLKVTDEPPFVDPANPTVGTPLGQPVPDNPAPFGTVYQTVPLRGGHYYVLSWWDMARAANGGPAVDTPKPYFVGIYDKSWRLLALSSPVAGSGGEDGNEWSPRRELGVTPFADGEYHVAFSPSELGERPASLAIANVQLEEPDKNLSSSSTYKRTEASRTVLNAQCKAVDSEQLRKAFVRRCEGGRADGKAETCYYELQKDIILDSEQLEFGYGGLVGKVGRDNYNTRHVDLGLNLVGTGVLDCSGSASPACYAASYVEYDLQHIAFNAPIVDYARQTHCFNFAAGAVRSGKALANERYLTLPLSSSDEAMLSQPAFLKTELFGRPLSGLYKLRIRDNPALVWENLEDVQLVLGYRYWSRVAKPDVAN